jgi:hypothetical protein
MSHRKGRIENHGNEKGSQETGKEGSKKGSKKEVSNPTGNTKGNAQKAFPLVFAGSSFSGRPRAALERQ